MSGPPSKGRTVKRLAVAVTGHGFGHATRTAAVLQGLLELRPSLDVTVSSTSPRRLFENVLKKRFAYRQQAYEPGTVQKNCFEVDANATLRLYRHYSEEREARLRAETEFLRSGGFSGLLADIPAIAIRAAADAGIPAAGLWNFTWDWILEPILSESRTPDPTLRSLPAILHEDYSLAGLHLRLPFSPRETSLAKVEDAPLVGRKSMATREATLERVGLAPDDGRPVVLVAMGGWDCGDWRPISVDDCTDMRFLVVGDVPLESRSETRAIPASLGKGYSFCDLVAACDVVLSKPGYGIASECILNKTPLLGVERRGFREAPELVRDMSMLGHFREISLEDFFAGRWNTHLREILAERHVRQAAREDGASKIAERLIRYFDL